jgi:hypothetical protein
LLLVLYSDLLLLKVERTHIHRTGVAATSAIQFCILLVFPSQRFKGPPLLLFL